MVRPSKKSKAPELESDARIALRLPGRPYTGSLRGAENLTHRTCHSIDGHGSESLSWRLWVDDGQLGSYQSSVGLVPINALLVINARIVGYSENGAFATTSAKLGDLYPSTYRTPKSRTMLSKVDSGFRRAMLQRHSLSSFLSARRGNSAKIAPCLSCGIRSRPAPRTSAVIPEWVIATSGSL
jgi:hypothetical protein